MLSLLRSKAGGIVAKVFIGLLAASFAVWGISDVFTGRQDDTLATVGETTITVEQFQQTFRSELSRLSQQLGKPVTPDEARQLGMDKQVLARLIRNAALDEEVRRLGLDLSPEFVARRIARLDIFKNPATGRFDPALLRQMLARAGISEAQFVDEERRGILRAALLRPVEEGMAPPESLTELVYRHRNAARDVAFFTVPADDVKVPEPTEEELKAFYERNKALFAIPERRQLAVLAVLPRALAGSIEIPEEEIRAYYEQHKDEFGQPERRVIDQIAFNSRKEAEDARRRLQEGKATWADIAKERGLTEKDTQLGSFTRKTFPDPRIADAVFALGKGEISQPLEGTLSISLVRVRDITPGREKSLDEAREEILSRLRLDKAKDKAYELHDQIEDRRASGQSLDDIARELGLKLRILPPLSAEGLDEKGRRVEVPGGADLLRAAFESDMGVDNDPVPTADDGFVWFDVRDIRPAGTEPFEKVKDRVARLWKKEKRRELTLQKAREFLRRARAGEDFAKLAEEAGSQVRTIGNIRRGDARPDFPMAAVRALFAGPEEGFVVAPAADGVSALVIRITPLALPPMDSRPDEVKAIRQVLAQSLAEDTQGEFLAALQKEFGVKINRMQWARITGAPLQ
jgi:peptidyl-prolyl cis-trans isomerase D